MTPKTEEGSQVAQTQVAIPFLFSLDDEYMVNLHKQAVAAGLVFTPELVFENGSVYKGYLKDGSRHGPGV